MAITVVNRVGFVFYPFIRLVDIVKPQIVIDCFGSQYAWKVVAQRLHSVDRSVAADTDQPFDSELLHSPGNGLEHLFVFGIDVGSRRADDGSAQARVEFGNRREQRVQSDVWQPWADHPVEAFEQSVNLDAQFVGFLHGSEQCRI